MIEQFECIICHKKYNKSEVLLHKNGITEICPTCGLALDIKYISEEHKDG